MAYLIQSGHITNDIGMYAMYVYAMYVCIYVCNNSMYCYVFLYDMADVRMYVV